MSDDPRELERVADDAERAGDYALALRLRFQAGVMRLQMNGRIRRGRTTTTRAIGRQLRLREFDDLGRTFDAVVCLFSSIGYVGTEERLRAAIGSMARHAAPGGMT